MASVYIPKGTTDLTGLIAGGDSVYFMEGDQTVTAGMNLSALAALGDVYFGPAFTGSVPDLQFEASGTVRIESSGGNIGIIADGPTTATIAKIEMAGFGKLTVKTAGTITEFQQWAGQSVIQDSVVVTNLRMMGGKCQQYYKSTANTGWTIAGGTLLTGRGFSGTANVSGGTVVVRREDSSATVPTGATLNISGNGTSVKWVGGNLTALNLLHPGTWVDFTEIVAALTITDATGFAPAFYKTGIPTAASGTAIMKSGKVVTLTNAATQYGGKFSQFAIGASPPAAHD